MVGKSDWVALAMPTNKWKCKKAHKKLLLGKIYHVVIIEASSAVSQEHPKDSESPKSGGRLFAGYFSANDHLSTSSTTTQNRETPASAHVRAFEPFLRARWHPYTSEGVKCGVEAFVGDCGRE